MAYVAITKNLTEQVARKIESMRMMEYRSVPVVPNEFTWTAPTPAIEQAAWGKHYHLKATTPPEWTKQAAGMQLVVKDGTGLEVILAVTFQPTHLTCPPRYESDYNSRIRVRFTSVDDLPVLQDEAKAYVAYRQAVGEIDGRWKGIAQQVKSFLGHCKSLNEGLKLWPDLRIYIPKEFLDKAEEKTAKAAKQESAALKALASIDTDALVAAAVGARMAGATNHGGNEE